MSDSNSKCKECGHTVDIVMHNCKDIDRIIYNLKSISISLEHIADYVIKKGIIEEEQGDL